MRGACLAEAFRTVVAASAECNAPAEAAVRRKEPVQLLAASQRTAVVQKVLVAEAVLVAVFAVRQCHRQA